jgi:hypothetical protein
MKLVQEKFNTFRSSSPLYSIEQLWMVVNQAKFSTSRKIRVRIARKETSLPPLSIISIIQGVTAKDLLLSNRVGS